MPYKLEKHRHGYAYDATLGIDPDCIEAADRIEALEVVLREDINILLNLLNPLHSELDKQSYDEKLSQNFLTRHAGCRNTTSTSLMTQAWSAI